jgi:hypothetical protein
MSNQFIWIYSGGRGREVDETSWGGARYKSLWTSDLATVYIWKISLTFRPHDAQEKSMILM